MKFNSIEIKSSYMVQEIVQGLLIRLLPTIEKLSVIEVRV